MHNKFDYFMILQSLQLSALASKARRKMSFLFITRLLIVCAEEGEIFHDYNAIKSPDLQCFYFISQKILRANKFQSRLKKIEKFVTKENVFSQRISRKYCNCAIS